MVFVNQEQPQNMQQMFLPTSTIIFSTVPHLEILTILGPFRSNMRCIQQMPVQSISRNAVVGRWIAMPLYDGCVDRAIVLPTSIIHPRRGMV